MAQSIEQIADKLAQTTEIGIKVLLAGPGVKEKLDALMAVASQFDGFVIVIAAYDDAPDYDDVADFVRYNREEALAGAKRWDKAVGS
jgi:hypothetical protein